MRKHLSDRGLIFGIIDNEFLQCKKTNNPIKKREKIWTSTKQNLQMINNYKEKWLILLVIEEMHIKTTLTYYLYYDHMDKI